MADSTSNPLPGSLTMRSDFIRLFQLHVDLFHATVLDGVVQSFLQNSKQAKPYFAWEDAGHVISEVDLYKRILPACATT